MLTAHRPSPSVILAHRGPSCTRQFGLSHKQRRDQVYPAYTGIPDGPRRLGIAYDLYTHADTERHIQQAQRFFRTLLDCDPPLACGVWVLS